MDSRSFRWWRANVKNVLSFPPSVPDFKVLERVVPHLAPGVARECILASCNWVAFERWQRRWTHTGSRIGCLTGREGARMSQLRGFEQIVAMHENQERGSFVIAQQCLLQVDGGC